MPDHDRALSPRIDKDALQDARERTPARVFVGRTGPAYPTATWLKLREDHAAARDAVQAEIDLRSAFGADRIAAHGLFTVQTSASSKAEYLRRPDLGRKLNEESRALVLARGTPRCDLQVAIGDGLSARAVEVQAPELLDRLHATALDRGWSFGVPFLVRYCRVGVMNRIGELLAPAVVVLLIGERPGLATAESLSAYMAYRPGAAQTDADRNLISNIHHNGVSLEDAARRITALAEQYRTLGRSGLGVTEVKKGTS